jgi:hypothetical protein
MMFLLTQNLPKHYPVLNSQQWRARVFQAITTVAGTWTLLITVANLSRFFNPDPFSIAFGAISAIAGFAAYFVYSRFVRPEILQGRIRDMDLPLIIAGGCGLMAGGAGILLLIQGILIAVQKDELKKPEALIKSQDAEQSQATEAVNAPKNDEKLAQEP